MMVVFAAASEKISMKNINCTKSESIERLFPLCYAAQNTGISVRGYVSFALGCPYEGDVSPTVVAQLSTRLIDAGCYEISL